ncbi:MAG: S41 family peptidase [Saccharofermentanales bacterium]
MSIPDAFTDYILEPIKTEVQSHVLLRGISLSRDEATQDFFSFRYILDNAYSGKEYFEKNGVSFNDCYNQIDEFIKQSEKISIRDLCEKYFKVFSDKLVDAHLSFICNGETLVFCKSYKAYFADIIVEKKNNIYLIASSNLEDVNNGDIIDCDRSMLFPTLSPVDNEYYLYGIRSWEEINQVDIKINGKDHILQLHLCRSGTFIPNESRLTHSTINSINIIQTPKFSIYDADGKYCEDFAQELFACGEKLRNEKTVVWNLLSNTGGNSNYPMSLVKGLNEYAHWKCDYAVLNSPAVNSNNYKENEKLYREWSFITSEPYDYSKGIYDGDLYVLTNSQIASSGESAVSFAKSIKNTILIGENTRGCGNFGDTLSFRLPHTNMIMVVPHKLFLGMFREGEGFTPDFWVDNEDVQGEVIKWLSDPNAYTPYSIK